MTTTIDIDDQATWPESARDILREWDRAAGIVYADQGNPDADVTEAESHRDGAINAANPGWDSPEAWLEALAEGDVRAIIAGRHHWGLPAFS